MNIYNLDFNRSHFSRLDILVSLPGRQALNESKYESYSKSDYVHRPRGVIVYGAMNPWGKRCTIKYLLLAIQTTRQNQIRRFVIVLLDKLILPSALFPHF